MTTNNNETEANTFSTIASPEFVFTFTNYQLQVLAAIADGCSTAAGIREYLADETDGQAGASARRKTYETIACLVKAGLCSSERNGRYRTVAILEEASEFVQGTLKTAGLTD